MKIKITMLLVLMTTGTTHAGTYTYSYGSPFPDGHKDSRHIIWNNMRNFCWEIGSSHVLDFGEVYYTKTTSEDGTEHVIRDLKSDKFVLSCAYSKGVVTWRSSPELVQQEWHYTKRPWHGEYSVATDFDKKSTILRLK